MDRGAVLLQAFQSRLRGYLLVINRSVHGTAEIVPTSNGEFEVVVHGLRRDGTTWEHKKLFDRATCFGRTYAFGEAAWQVEGRPCDHARAIIEAVLRERGVL